MPRQDGAGPMGQGPMTGRGMGPCGRGRRGFFGGAGYGMGCGAGYVVCPQRQITVEDLEDEKQALKNELTALEEEIKAFKMTQK